MLLGCHPPGNLNPDSGPGCQTCTIPFTSLAYHWPSHAHLAQIQFLGQVVKLVQFLLQAFYNIGHPMLIWPRSRFWASWLNLYNSFYKPFTTLAIPYHLAQIQMLVQVGKLVQFLLQPIHNIGHPMPSRPTSRFWAKWPNLCNSF